MKYCNVFIQMAARSRGGRRTRQVGSTVRRSSRNVDPITVDLCHPHLGCIDLTNDVDDCDEDEAEVVAFTSFMDDSVVCLGQVPTTPGSENFSRVNCRRVPQSSSNRSSSRSPIIRNGLLPKEQIEIPVIRVSDNEETTVEPTSKKKDIICPICLENEAALPLLKKQLVSTVCGHLFCNDCIRSAIRSDKRCPTCRRKLTLKQFHPIFI